jgi:hypothetical protein
MTILAIIAREPDAPELYDLIVGADLTTILNLAIDDEKIDAVCKQTRFAKHWELKWQQCEVYFAYEINENDCHENVVIPTLSCFELLKGRSVYQDYRKLVDNQEMTTEVFSSAKEFLELSASLGCFYALTALCVNGLQLLKDASMEPSTRAMLAKEILSYANKAADLHFTPGYLLLSNVYQELFLYRQDIYPDAPLQMQKKYFFMQALIALYQAQRLEIYSADMLHNAYQGKTIKEATGGVISSWLQAKTRLQKMSGNIIQTADMDEASKQANVSVRRIVARYGLSAPDCSEDNNAEYKSLRENRRLL